MEQVLIALTDLSESQTGVLPIRPPHYRRLDLNGDMLIRQECGVCNQKTDMEPDCGPCRNRSRTGESGSIRGKVRHQALTINAIS